MEIYKEFTFEAAHLLPRVPSGHKCGRLHGHSFRAIVALRGPVGENGFVLDFAEMSRLVKPVIAELDHHYLNEVQGLDNPTCENIAHWLWHRLSHVPLLVSVEVKETCTSGCVYP